jgi:hypothetical protein
MRLRDVGIIGYAVLFPIAGARLFVPFARASSDPARPSPAIGRAL